MSPQRDLAFLDVKLRNSLDSVVNGYNQDSVKQESLILGHKPREVVLGRYHVQIEQHGESTYIADYIKQGEDKSQEGPDCDKGGPDEYYNQGGSNEEPLEYYELPELP